MAPVQMGNSFGLILLLWNARSVLSNFVEFKRCVSVKKPHIICLTETWLDVHSKFKLEGYTIFRKDRPDRRGGGIAVLVKNTINCEPLPNLVSFDNGKL